MKHLSHLEGHVLEEVSSAIVLLIFKSASSIDPQTNLKYTTSSVYKALHDSVR